MDPWQEFGLKLEIAQETLHPGTRLHEWNSGETITQVDNASGHLVAIETLPREGISTRSICVVEVTPENMDEFLASLPQRSKNVFEFKGA